MLYYKGKFYSMSRFFYRITRGGISVKKMSKGFTLVELVVVIAIIGVLAAILVPSMLNYVRKSRLKSANTNAKTAYNAVAEFLAEQESKGISREQAISYYGGNVIDCTTPPTGNQNQLQAQEAVYSVLAENGVTAGNVWVGEQTINSTASFYVQWTGDEDPTLSTAIFGQYPDPITWDSWKNGSPHWKQYNEYD